MKVFTVLSFCFIGLSLLVQLSTAAIVAAPSSTDKAPPNGLWRVVFALKAPLVIYDPSQPPEYQYSGYFIEFWKATARELGINYTTIIVQNHVEAVNMVADGLADFAVAPPVTSERLAKGVDFSQSVLEGSLQIMSTVDSSVNYLAYLRPFSWQVWALTLAFVIITAHMAWAMERNTKNPLIPQYYLSGIRETIWWSAMTLVFRAVSEVKVSSFPAKLLKFVIGFVSMILVADYISTLSTLINMGSASPIQGPEDLLGKMVGTMDGTSSLEFIRSYGGMTPVIYNTPDEMAYALLNRTIDGIIYDSPTLTWLMRSIASNSLTIVPKTLFLEALIFQVKLREQGVSTSLFQKWIAPPRSSRVPQVTVASSAGIWIAGAIMCAFVIAIWLLKIVCVRKRYKKGRVAKVLGYDPTLDIRFQQQQQQQKLKDQQQQADQSGQIGSKAGSLADMTALNPVMDVRYNSDVDIRTGLPYYGQSDAEEYTDDENDGDEADIVRARLLR